MIFTVNGLRILSFDRGHRVGPEPGPNWGGFGSKETQSTKSGFEKV